MKPVNLLGHAAIWNMHSKELQVDGMGINSQGGSEWTLTLQLLHYVTRPSARWQILTHNGLYKFTHIATGHSYVCWQSPTTVIDITISKTRHYKYYTLYNNNHL